MTGHLLPAAEADTPSAGPKAASLARMTGLGLPVPPFFVVNAAAYREHAVRAGAAPGTTPGAGDVSRLREAIASTPLDPDVRAQVLSALADIGDAPVAVRSSGTAEDLPGASFAGQHGTYFAGDADEVLRRVTDCWASLWTDRAYAYRVRQGIAHDDVAMAVIIQRLVPAEAAGVAFTADPLTGARRVVVESCWGVGEMLVSGRVAPDHRVFSVPDLTVLETRGGTKPVALLTRPDGRLEEVTLTAERATAPSVTEDIARDVARLALQAEEMLGAPADVEWALADGRLWLLQARPVTTAVSAVTPAQRYRLTAWSNVNTGEVLPDVVTPMTWSIVGRMASALIEALFGKLGVRCAHDRLTTLVAGRAYFNATLLVSAVSKMPLAGGADVVSLFGGADAPAGYNDLPPSPEDTVRVSPTRAVLGIPLIIVWLATHSPSRAERACARMRAATDASLARLAVASDEDAIAAETDMLARTLLEMSDALAFMGVGMANHCGFVDLARSAFGDEGNRIVNTLLAGQGGVASAEAGLALARLGELGRRDPELGTALRSSTEWRRVRERLEQTDAPPVTVFLDAWDRFLVEHGHHARGELELGSPRWVERPDEVLAMVVGLLDVPESADLLASHRARAADASAAEARALAQLGPLRRLRFRHLLGQTRKGARTRENLKNEGVRALAATRTALLALGEKLVARGVLVSAEDVLFLRWDEVPAVRSGALDPHAPVAQRRAEYEHNRTLTPPPIVIGEWDGQEVRSGGAPADELRGLAVASGVARGRARVIRSLQSGERVLTGEVLVAPFTDPGWTPYFVPAAGIVVDMGGMLSHGSIIAREYGIPAVVNVGDATSSIATGDLIEVDGDRGVVRVLERHA